MMERNNLDALKAKCKLICNTCYADRDVLVDTLIDHDIDPMMSYDTSNAAALIECAVIVVKGWVETSRSEGGVSASIDPDKVEASIRFYCGRYSLDADELLADTSRTIENGTNLW